MSPGEEGLWTLVENSSIVFQGPVGACASRQGGPASGLRVFSARRSDRIAPQRTICGRKTGDQRNDGQRQRAIAWRCISLARV
jgi:hypothetical protein